VTNRAHVSNAGDTDPANDVGSDLTTVSPAIDLSITKTPVGVFRVGGNGIYEMEISNVGAAATIGDITVIDTLPTGLSVRLGRRPHLELLGDRPVRSSPASMLRRRCSPARRPASRSRSVSSSAALPSVVNRVSSPPRRRRLDRQQRRATSPVLVSDLKLERREDRVARCGRDRRRARLSHRHARGRHHHAHRRVLNDALPSGFAYVPGTARVDGVAIT
jgi:uncharacterized repeat protein (TIGR01451 family)